jgi:hypothetical protein
MAARFGGHLDSLAIDQDVDVRVDVLYRTLGSQHGQSRRDHRSGGI